MNDRKIFHENFAHLQKQENSQAVKEKLRCSEKIIHRTLNLHFKVSKHLSPNFNRYCR